MAAILQGALAPIWLRGADELGPRARTNGRPVLINEGLIAIGADLRLGSSPIVTHFRTYPGGRIVIGNRVVISYGAAISAQGSVTLEDDVHLGPFTLIMDSDFHKVGDRDALGESRAVWIGQGARLGARVTVLPGSRIGAYARIQSGAVVSGNIAPGAIAGGMPARPLEEARGAPANTP